MFLFLFFSFLLFSVNSSHCGLWKYQKESQIWDAGITTSLLLTLKHHIFFKSKCGQSVNSFSTLTEWSLCSVVCVCQGWAFSSEPFSTQGAGHESQHLGARSQLFGRGDEQTDWLSGHSSDSCSQPQRQPQGQISEPPHHLTRGYCISLVQLWNITRV